MGLQIAVPDVSWVALLPLSLSVLDRGHWPSEGVSNPSPVSFEDLIFRLFLLGPFPEFSVADGRRPLDPKDFSGQVLMNISIFFSVTAIVFFVSSPYTRTGFGAEDPGCDVDGQVR